MVILLTAVWMVLRAICCHTRTAGTDSFCCLWRKHTGIGMRSGIRKEREVLTAGVMNTEGEDVTAEFLLGADFALREAKKYDCTIAILKERSPSCGSNGIYDGTFSHKLREGMGKTAALLAGYGLKVYGESRLKELEAVINSGELN